MHVYTYMCITVCMPNIVLVYIVGNNIRICIRVCIRMHMYYDWNEAFECSEGSKVKQTSKGKTILRSFVKHS